MVVAGLTGGIATGKSTVAAVFEEAGARLIDADRIARAAVRKGAPAHEAIVAHFGAGVLLDDGEIDRRRLAAVIFNDPAEQRALEQIVHPQVRQEIDRRIELIRQQAPEALVIVDIPLLFESGMQSGLDAVIVVYAPEHLQLERLMARDGLAAPEARARIRSQMPIESKKSLATQVIDNSGSLESTRAQTMEVYRRLTSTARRA
jgi:dephospho-CoA kinase